MEYEKSLKPLVYKTKMKEYMWSLHGPINNIRLKKSQSEDTKDERRKTTQL